MFKRDEVYDLLVQLTGQAMQRWLKNAGGDAPGQSNNADFTASELHHKRSLQELSKLSEPRSTQLVSPLKHDLAAQKRNHAFDMRFRLPMTEHLITGLSATYSKEMAKDRDPVFYSQVPAGNLLLTGHVYLSQTFLAFESIDRLPAPQQHLPMCKAVFPLYTIKRVERLNKSGYTSGVSIMTIHKTEHEFTLHVRKKKGKKIKAPVKI